MSTRKNVILLLVVSLAGCVPSLHPLYTKQTLVYDPSVVGTWQQDNNQWEFAGKPKDSSYALAITEKDGRVSQLDAHLVSIQGHRFLDLYPSDNAKVQCGQFVKFCLVPAHLFLAVEKRPDALLLRAMDPDAIVKLLKDKPDMIKHEIIEDGRVVLTDTPENLQQFLIQGLTIDGFFSDPATLKPAVKAIPAGKS